jgi:hypothetical protein
LIRYLLAMCIMLNTSLMAEFAHRVENTNYTLFQDSSVFDNDRYIYNYDRLRYRLDYSDEKFFFTLIGDGVNYYGRSYVHSSSFSYLQRMEADVPFETQTTFNNYDEGSAYAKLYRFYGGYEDERNRVVLGLQNISLGVGRIWTPTNLFNPSNVYALEPDEVFGVFGVSYTRHLTDMGHISGVISQKKDHSFKYALRYKAFLDFIDVGLSYINSNETEMIGYELEANLGETGIEVRSEGAYTETWLKSGFSEREKEYFFQSVVGADYGFKNGITVTFEAKYSSKDFSKEEVVLNRGAEVFTHLSQSKFYTALSLRYDFNLVLTGAVLYVESLNTHRSRFISPTLTYTLNDYNSIIIGAMLNTGSQESEFGSYGDTYYLNYKLSF